MSAQYPHYSQSGFVDLPIRLIISLCTRQKSQEPLERLKLMFDVEQDMTDEVEAMPKEGFEPTFRIP
jgi:hypothetical protein